MALQALLLRGSVRFSRVTTTLFRAARHLSCVGVTLRTESVSAACQGAVSASGDAARDTSITFLLQGGEWASVGFPVTCPQLETQVCDGGLSDWWGEGAGGEVLVCGNDGYE